MKYEIRRTSQFKKDYKRAYKRGLSIEKLDTAIEILANEGYLPSEYDDHPLSGNKKGLRECHIEPDWLLIYVIDHDVLLLILTSTGSHSDLF